MSSSQILYATAVQFRHFCPRLMHGPVPQAKAADKFRQQAI